MAKPFVERRAEDRRRDCHADQEMAEGTGLFEVQNKRKLGPTQVDQEPSQKAEARKPESLPHQVASANQAAYRPERDQLEERQNEFITKRRAAKFYQLGRKLQILLE